MSDREIFRVLNARLATFTASPQPEFAWEPTLYKPDKTKRWLRPTMLPFEPETLTASSPIVSDNRGIYQVDCFVEEKKDGSDAAWGLADAVSNHFFPTDGQGLALAGPSGLVVDIQRRPSKDPLSAQGGFIGVAVLVRYFAQIIAS